MERIGIAGISIHGSDVTGLEQVRRPTDDGALRDLADALGASELVFLATCNRVEVIYAREEGDLPSVPDLGLLAAELSTELAARQLEETLLLRTGRDAVRHLFRVAASLDSLVVGEDQIIAQVREAYGRAADIGLVGPLLGPLFHHALAIGKRVRADTDLARHPVSVVSLATRELLTRPEAQHLRSAVLGAGEMSSLVARVLQDAGAPPTYIVNRTHERARELADECGATAVTLESFQAAQHPVDVIVSATSAPGVVLTTEQLGALTRCTPTGAPLLGFDLAVPRDLAPTPGVEIIDIDALRHAADHNRSLRAEAAVAAEQLVEQKVATFARRAGEQAAAPLVSELTDASRDLLERELNGLLGGRLAHLDERDRRAVERWARATFGRMQHLPVLALKQLATELTSGRVDDPAAPEPSETSR